MVLVMTMYEYFICCRVVLVECHEWGYKEILLAQLSIVPHSQNGAVPALNTRGFRSFFLNLGIGLVF